jgi:hypothetical protein
MWDKIIEDVMRVESNSEFKKVSNLVNVHFTSKYEEKVLTKADEVAEIPYVTTPYITPD